jgi:ABC-type branched-subunit amino acid transport system permease subunit
MAMARVDVPDTGTRWLRPENETRRLLLRWLVVLLVPVLLFTFWVGEGIVNNILLGIFDPQDVQSQYTLDTFGIVQAGIFIIVFYAGVTALTGYLVASDSGRRGTLWIWLDVLFMIVAPLLFIIITDNLLIGLSIYAIELVVYLLVRRYIRKATNYSAPPPLDHIEVLGPEQQALLMSRAKSGGFWFATIFAVISLIADIVFAVLGSLPLVIWAWIIVRTLFFPIAGYYLGVLGGRIALRRAITPKVNERVVNGLNGVNGANGADSKVRGRSFLNGIRVSRQQQLESLSSARATEEAADLVPNDLPLQSRGAQRFYLLLLTVFILFFPVLDPILFGPGSNGRISGYGDLGYYVILALGLNIVVGFAGLLDLGYVAFFAIGTYAWGIVGSAQIMRFLPVVFNPQVWPWFFWPMLLVAALIAAFFGLVLGAPTLRLRGDYLAIVTLGFGEIIPLFFLNLTKYTGGTNGIVGILAPTTPCIQPYFCIQWSSFNSVPFYYLILALIAISIFVNIRLRDSRLGRAWVALREDEIAASSSGINITRTKLFAFAAGAFFSGIAGVYHASKLGTVSPTDFSYTDSVIYLAMVVIGGLGSIPGVIVGAVVVYSINQFILAQLDTLASNPGNILSNIHTLFPSFTFSSIRDLLFGATLIIIMIYRPEGLLPSARRKRELHRPRAEEEEDLGALDEPPGSLSLESEMRVE